MNNDRAIEILEEVKLCSPSPLFSAALVGIEAIKQNEALQTEIARLKCCGNCEYWIHKYQKCEHPDQRQNEADDYCKESTDKCELWNCAY